MTTCYRELNSTLQSSNDVPCGGSDPTGCCAYGDFCMSNGICHYTQPNPAGSGYYLQSCTNSTFQSAICAESFHCTTLDYSSIVYNATTGLWACCSSNSTGFQCSIATNETWAAPPPEALATLTSIEQKPATSTNVLSVSSPASSLASTISPITPTTTTITTTTPLSLPPSTPSFSLSKSHAVTSTSGTSGISMTTDSASISSNTAAAIPTSTSTASVSASTASIHKTRLSPAASAGIGVGVVFGLIALVALTYLAILTLRKRKRKRQSSVATLFGGPDPNSDNHPRDHAIFSNKPGLGTTDAGLLNQGGYRPQRFTGEPQFQQEISGVPVRYEATDYQRYGTGTGRGLR